MESCSTIPPLANSDHNGIQLHVLLKCPKRKEKITPRKVWKYSLADYDAMAVLLSDVDWDQVLSGDVDECWSKWKTTFLRIMGICIPHLTFTPRDRVPWLTNSLIKNIRKRKALYQTYKLTGSLADHAKYKAQRNLVVSLLRSSKEEFFS